jgi:hypothetical protein
MCGDDVGRIAVVYMCVWWYMCEPCQESSGCVYVSLVVYVSTMSGEYHQTHIYTTAILLTWFTHIPPNTHINNRYSPDTVHTYTTKHTYTQPLLSWHGSHIYHQTHKRYSPDMVHLCICVFGGICVIHVRRVAVVYMCVWWYMCEPCQEGSGCVYVCLVVYVHNRYSPDMVHIYTTKHTYTLPLLSWHGSHIYHQTHIYTTATLLTLFTHIPPVWRIAVVYMCVWWYMCEPCQESSGSVYVCLVVYMWTMSGE